MIKISLIEKIEPRCKDFERINLQEFQSMLQTSKGAKILTLVSVTSPDLKKGSPPCQKISRINCVINWDYSNAVNAQLKREGKEPDFQASPRKWGTRLNNSPFVSHVTGDGKHQLYLEIKVENSLGHIYYNSLTNEFIHDEDVEPFLKAKSKPDQGTDKEIILRDYKVSNIAAMFYKGQGYLIKENVDESAY